MHRALARCNSVVTGLQAHIDVHQMLKENSACPVGTARGCSSFPKQETPGTAVGMN